MQTITKSNLYSDEVKVELIKLAKNHQADKDANLTDFIDEIVRNNLAYSYGQEMDDIEYKKFTRHISGIYNQVLNGMF